LFVCFFPADSALFQIRRPLEANDNSLPTLTLTLTLIKGLLKPLISPWGQGQPTVKAPPIPRESDEAKSVVVNEPVKRRDDEYCTPEG